MLSQDPEMLKIFDMIAKMADIDCPVLIQGASGTGKELVANAIHKQSYRRERPFIAVNCAALPESLLESELFGHEKGAFTGAIAARKGIFEQASGGTLFLDEVAETSLPFQVPQDLILLGRCLAILSGMCTGLDSQFDLWESTMPFAQELLAEEVTGGWEFWRDEAIDLVKTTIFLPKRLERVLERVERGKLDVRVPELTGHLRRVEAGMRRMVSALIFAALLMGGVQLYLADRYSASGILFGGAFLSLVWVLLTRPRRR